MDKFVKEIYKFQKLKPSEFCEQFFGIRLLDFQKKLVDMQYKGNVFIQTRNPRYKLETYIRLLLAYINMKDDGTIAIARPDDVKILNKKEFGEWLGREYWR